MRIGIVNDQPIAVEALKRVVIEAGYNVAWVALNGQIGVEKCCLDKPDLVLMDLFMPVMDGAAATRRIMMECPCPILIVTASVESHSSKVFEAMGAGALDVVATPELGPGGDLEGGSSLISKISVISKIHGNGLASKKRAVVYSKRSSVPPLLAIGSSTGGPSALATLLRELPEDFPAAIAIVQHVDGQFTENLAKWLDSQTKMNVSIARSGDALQAGQVVLAPGNRHMLMSPGGIVQITTGSGDSLYVPSVDLFFESLCSAGFPIHSVGVLLTGMGADGARGLLGLRKIGWRTIAQDEKSSVVWGMPGAAVKMGAAHSVCSISDIPRVLLRHFTKNFRRKDHDR